MFTLNIKHTVVAGRGAMKWETLVKGPTDTPTKKVDTVSNYIDELKKQAISNKDTNPDKSLKMLEVANNIEKSQSTLGRSLARLHQSIPTPTTYEIGEQKAIAAFMSVGINQDKAEDYAEIFVDVIKKTKVDLSQLKVSIDHKDGIDFQEMKDLLLDPINFTQENNKERFLSLFRGMKKTAVRTSNFGAHQFEQAISLYTQDTNSLAKSIKDITGKDLGKDEKENQAIASEYIKKVNERSDFLSRMFALYNGTPQMGGLEAVMTGRDNAMLTELFGRADISDKLQKNGINQESLWEYIKNTGLTLPLPGMQAIGSYEKDINLDRNARGLRADNSQKGESLYVKSNVFGLVDQMSSGAETGSFGKVAADVVRTIIRPIELGISIDKRARLVENSTLVAALSWNAIFDMKSGKVNEKWESNVDVIIGEFQKSNSLPDGFNKEALIANMKEQVVYFDSIKQTGDGAEVKNSVILTQLRGAYVDQVAALTASRVDQGSKLDGVSAGFALLVLPFVKINNSALSVNRTRVDSNTNDVAKTAARLVKNPDKMTVDSLGFDHIASKNGIHTYILKEGKNIDLTKVQLPEGTTLNATLTGIVSQYPLSMRMQQAVGVDVTQGTHTELIVEKAKEIAKQIELKDVFTKSNNVITFNSKIGDATIDIKAIKGWEYDDTKKELILPDNMEIVMKPEQDDSGKLTKIVILPASSGTGDKTRLVESERNLEKSLGGSIYEMTRIRSSDSSDIRKTKEKFSAIMVQISNQEYTEANSALEKMSKYSQVAKNILKTLNGDNNMLATNPDKLAMILSYTYGAFDKDHEGVMGAKEYKKARAGTHEAEKRFAPDRSNDANEATFLSLENHTPQSLGDKYGTDRAISVSVFATPKGGKHRIDKLDGAITVSKEAIATLNDKQRDAVIIEHKIAIAAGLDRVNKILPKESQMTQSEYIAILKGGPIDPKFVGLSLSKSVEFFEARAMISGNRCANKVEGMVLPTFAFKNTDGKYSIEEKVVTPEYSIDTVFEGDRASIDASSTGTGAMQKNAHGYKETQHKTITTKPGEVIVKGKEVVVNGTVIGTTESGKLMIQGTTFRLAPEQTIEQFLGKAGKIPNQELINMIIIEERPAFARILGLTIITNQAMN